jgi:hypothetical protein
MSLNLFYRHSIRDACDMSKIKQPTAALPVHAPHLQRLCGFLAGFRSICRRYWNTPIGCEITARWILGESAVTRRND